jgi:acetyl esterase/lipase
MTSLQMRAVAAVLRLTRKRAMATAERASRRLAAPKASSTPPAALVRRHAVTRREVGGFPCTTVAPRGRAAGRAAVYLHGGAYVSGIAPQHWALVARLADAGVRVEVPHYGLAPQHTYRAAYPLLTTVYRELLADVDPSAVTLAGDSPEVAWPSGWRRPWPAPGCPSRGGSCCSRPGWT